MEEERDNMCFPQLINTDTKGRRGKHPVILLKLACLFIYSLLCGDFLKQAKRLRSLDSRSRGANVH